MTQLQLHACCTLLITLVAAQSKVQGVKCKDCRGVDSPPHCIETTVCGTGEICSTEEYTDTTGQQAFRLGCANAMRCRLFVNAKTIFGKRQVSASCYECCDKDGCNANLCSGSLGHAPSVAPHVQMGNSSGCPDLFIPFKNRCYLIAPGLATWMTAKTFCRKLGANLVSLNSKEEHDFLKGIVIKLNASFFGGYWTGGFYSHDAAEFEYVDGSPFNYTQWYPTYPKGPESKESYISMGNPGYTGLGFAHSLATSPMFGELSTTNYGIICESRRI